jgi:hypothetical protein
MPKHKTNIKMGERGREVRKEGRTWEDAEGEGALGRQCKLKGYIARPLMYSGYIKGRRPRTSRVTINCLEMT